jgi:dynein heavy chain
MGSFFDTAHTTSMDQLYNDSTCSTTIIFILSAGADPTATLLKFASEKDKEVTVISLG